MADAAAAAGLDDAAMAMPDDLEAVEALLWQKLARAVKDRRSAWHTPALATVDAEGAPQVRTLVLRAASREAGLIRLHTDLRAGKVRDVGREPRVQLMFYDKGARLQLRLSGRARAEAAGPQADAAWEAATLFARRCYLAPVGPGAVCDGPTSGLPEVLEQREPSREESLAGRPHFAVLLVEAWRLEFLHLAVTGHRRGFMARQADRWERGWLVP